MIGLLLLVSIFTQFSPQNALLPLSSGPAEVVVEFAELKGLSVGSAVLLDGHLVGKVRSVVESEGASSHLVNLDIAPSYRTLLRQGTIALIKSPLTLKSRKPRPVVELLINTKNREAVLQDGARIFGFSSYEEFWSADLSKIGLPLEAFQATLG